MMNIREHRTPEHDIEELLLRRWSPRAMSGEPIAETELMRLFEAARWAPSSYDNQPWRFLYALRDSDAWAAYFDALVESNQSWCRNAAALILIVAGKLYEHNGKPAPTHDFDTGMATENLALQGTAMDLVVHFMVGFDQDKIRRSLGVPDDHAVIAMVAVGRPGRVEDLPEAAREREKPSDRKPLKEIAFQGRFPTT
jgi:nitroreductase